MRHLAWIIAIIPLLASCAKRGAKLSDSDMLEEQPLQVAVMPTLDCLPVYYADRMGLFDSTGVKVTLTEYLSQMDIDTALLRRRTQMGHCSLTRLEIMERRDSDTLRVVGEMAEKLYLLTARNKRIRNLKQMKGNMLAIDRFSNADYWSDRITELGDMELTDIYRPQVNDIQLRTLMLTTHLVDAALLPEPYATQARMAGELQIFKTPDSVSGFNCFAALPIPETDSLSQRQEKLFVKAYARAVKELNTKPDADSLRAILSENYGLTDDIIDTLRLPKLKPMTEPSEENRKTASDWITQRFMQAR